jgi:hypothetical protein
MSNGRGLVWARDGRVRRWVAMVLLAALLPMAAGCFGRFPLTRAVYNFNKDLSEDEIVRSVTLWALVVVPVYGVATLGDVLVVHLIEFWSGERVDVTRATEADGTVVALEPSADGREATLTVTRDGAVLSRATFVRTSAVELEVRDGAGKLVGKVVRTEGGDLCLTDAEGRTVRRLAADAVAALPKS